MTIQENIQLAPYTVFKIGGSARYFCEAKNLDDISESIAWAGDKKVPIFIFGAGSNILVSDDGFNGLVIKIGWRDVFVKDNILTASAGVSMAQAVSIALKNNLGGFEWAVGIPGSVGGSVFGNAGCFGSETKDIIKSVSILEVGHDYKVKQKDLAKEECEFKYRHSIFKKHPEWIILSAQFELFSRDAMESRALVQEYSGKRTGAQDIGSKCAGCIFKNPSQDKSAGFLIDQAGLKDLRVGGASVSLKHANYIINDGTATATDVKKLISAIKEKIKKQFDVDLEEEVRYL